MQKQMPETVDFVHQVEINRTLEGGYPLTKLKRLQEVLATTADLTAVNQSDVQVTAKIEFCHSVGFASIKGKVSATLSVECQRCLQPMEIDVEGRFKFALIDSEEEMELLPDEFEPYLLEGEEQSIINLVEDELLLSLPMVIMHDNACSAVMAEQQEEIKAQKEAAHPFAALKDLKDSF
jgi:uncharacterized protein